MIDKYEVLAPVGKYEELAIVLNEEPDAIYVGFKGLTSRPSRTDFSLEEIISAIEICHREKIKIYVAINSNVPELEVNALLDAIYILDKNNVDGLILADYGVISLLAGKLQHAEIHASTLLGVYNIETVRILKNMGVRRIIFYANLYLDEMIQIINAFPDLEYELVAEGGTCFNDIRQCRLPHFITENDHFLSCRGGCALVRGDKVEKGKMLAEHPCRVAEVIGLYMAAGIKSYKIEGRTVPAIERIQVIRDLKKNIYNYKNGKPLNAYLHYVNRMRREVY